MAEQNKKLEIIRQRAYEYIVLLHPTVEQAEQGLNTLIIVPLTQVVANDQAAATVLANRAIPEDNMVNQARLEVVVRDF